MTEEQEERAEGLTAMSDVQLARQSCALVSVWTLASVRLNIWEKEFVLTRSKTGESGQNSETPPPLPSKAPGPLSRISAALWQKRRVYQACNNVCIAAFPKRPSRQGLIGRIGDDLYRYNSLPRPSDPVMLSTFRLFLFFLLSSLPCIISGIWELSPDGDICQDDMELPALLLLPL
ncbi:hypothetical protein GE09DRAFT_271834 [Coniochaeta sp. 2T2.1]|nr:hypothetical protein GE09DRAFT_271834 [Coniochaeta sp. 2T2.1]